MEYIEFDPGKREKYLEPWNRRRLSIWKRYIRSCIIIENVLGLIILLANCNCALYYGCFDEICFVIIPLLLLDIPLILGYMGLWRIIHLLVTLSFVNLLPFLYVPEFYYAVLPFPCFSCFCDVKIEVGKEFPLCYLDPYFKTTRKIIIIIINCKFIIKAFVLLWYPIEFIFTDYYKAISYVDSQSVKKDK